ncbi:MAG: tagaturonate reductase [Clostridiales bacterium]|nr:tagaturonate reductase [Clostridiales bacterium]
MEQLSYQTLKALGSKDYLLESAPEKVLQFGEGNFLRAFVDYFIDVANETSGFHGKVVAVQPIPAPALKEKFEAQNGLYTLYLRGIQDGRQMEKRRVVSCISRCISAVEEFQAVLACAHNPELKYIVSNTTEAGIVYRESDRMDDPATASFPGKLTLLLLERYRCLPDIGFVLFPCELIEENGKNLLACVRKYITLWELSGDFAAWVEEKNEFCSTLVDRIVPGYPKDADALNNANGYEDGLLVCGEPFGFWAIEGPGRLNDELPFAKAGLPVLVTEDCTGYKQRKVRILNGAHTSTVCAGLLCGLQTVGEMMADPLLRAFLEREVATEIIPTLDLPHSELDDFAASVIERFQNPFIRHELITITLNSTSKWRARVLPSVTEYVKRIGALPKLLTFSFAAYADFFRRGTFDCKDDREVLAFFAAHRTDSAEMLMAALCAQEQFWGQNLADIPDFLPTVTDAIQTIQNKGMRAALEAILS